MIINNIQDFCTEELLQWRIKADFLSRVNFGNAFHSLKIMLLKPNPSVITPCKTEAHCLAFFSVLVSRNEINVYVRTHAGITNHSFFLFSELSSNRRFVFWYLSIFIVPKCLQGNSIHARPSTIYNQR